MSERAQLVQDFRSDTLSETNACAQAKKKAAGPSPPAAACHGPFIVLTVESDMDGVATEMR